MSRVLVTGASGFVGSHIVDGLAEEGYAVRAFDSRPYPYLIPGSCESLEGDVTALGEVREAARKCDGIIHLAAVSRDGYDRPWECITTNMMGTANVLEAARRSETSPWVVLASSRDAPSIEDSVPASMGLYGIVKFCAELCARRYAEDYGVRALALRFSDVYGSDRDHVTKVLPLFVKQALSDEALEVRDPSLQFDFVHYQDAVTGVLSGVSYLEAQSKGTFHSVTLCTGQAVTLQELADTIVVSLDSTSSIKVKPGLDSRQGRTLDNDPSRAREILGFGAHTSLVEGVRRLAQLLEQSQPGL